MKRKAVKPVRRAAKPVRRRIAPIAAPAETKPAPKAIPPGAVHENVVAVYLGFRPAPEDLPVELLSFDAFVGKYGAMLSPGPVMLQELMFKDGRSYSFGQAGERPGTRWCARIAYPVLQTGRAVSDLRRALLMTQKAVGVLN